MVVKATSEVMVHKTELLPEGVPLSQVEASQVGLMWRIARRNAWVAGGKPWASFYDIDPFGDEGKDAFAVAHPEPEPTTVAVAIPGAAGTAAGSTLATNKVKVSLILDQADESEVLMPNQAQIKQWEKNYHDRKYIDPPDYADCTPQQCAAMVGRLAGDNSPYADFGVFTPLVVKRHAGIATKHGCLNRMGNSCQKNYQVRGHGMRGQHPGHVIPR